MKVKQEKSIWPVQVKVGKKHTPQLSPHVVNALSERDRVRAAAHQSTTDLRLAPSLPGKLPTSRTLLGDFDAKQQIDQAKNVIIALSFLSIGLLLGFIVLIALTSKGMR